MSTPERRASRDAGRPIAALLACAAAGLALGCRAEVTLARTGDGGEEDGGRDDGHGSHGEDDGRGGDVPEVGMQGLVIAGEIEAASRVSDGSDADDFDTHFALTVRRGGQVVSDANVTVRSGLGNVQLSNSGGTYVGAQRGYAQSYVLEVHASGDEIDGAPLVGPAPHTFLTPTTGGRYPAGAPLMVTWVPSGAEGVYVSTNNLPPTAAPDNGAFTVPGTALVAEGTRLRQDQVIVERGVDRTVQGALPSSLVHLEVTNGVVFYVEP